MIFQVSLALLLAFWYAGICNWNSYVKPTTYYKDTTMNNLIANDYRLLRTLLMNAVTKGEHNVYQAKNGYCSPEYIHDRECELLDARTTLSKIESMEYDAHKVTGQDRKSFFATVD